MGSIPIHHRQVLAFVNSQDDSHSRGHCRMAQRTPLRAQDSLLLSVLRLRSP